ncbi:MAG: PHP domain-containing protein [Anaerolineae bacterium]|nr:PHP domain-containing protein [Anaerolineae bacterium]
MTPRVIVADLHTHSTASDGEYAPSELVRAARDLGLQALALTDHDTIVGLDEALGTGQRIGLRVIPGVEVSIRFRRPLFVGTLHLLLYFAGDLLRDPDFRQAAQDVLGQGRGEALVRARVAAINAEFGPQGRQPALSRPLTAEEISAYAVNVTRRHFAQALHEKHGLEKREQVAAIIGNDSPAYVPSGIDLDMLPPFLARFPVVRILAHPAAGSFPGSSHYKEVLPPLEIVEELLPEFQSLGLDGLEVHYPGHTAAHRQLLLRWRERMGLPLVTGGSDCHDRAERPLGVEGVTQRELDRLLDQLQEGSCWSVC